MLKITSVDVIWRPRRMSPRRRFQTDVPETEIPDGCPWDRGSRRMSLRRRVQTDAPKTEDPDGCPRDGGSRRMSLRRRIQTDAPETEAPDGSPRDGRPGRTGTYECPWDGRSRRMSPPSWLFFSQTTMCAICLGLTFTRWMPQTDVPETDDREGGPRRMPQTDVPET